jgi:hypothetical protein
MVSSTFSIRLVEISRIAARLALPARRNRLIRKVQPSRRRDAPQRSCGNGGGGRFGQRQCSAARRNRACLIRRSDSTSRAEKFVAILFLFESDSRGCGIQRSKPNMNNQETTDKVGSPRRSKIMKNEAQSIYGLLASSEEKGRGAMEMAVYATCILSVVAAILQFISQPTPDPFAGFGSIAQPVPVVSRTVKAVSDSKS